MYFTTDALAPSDKALRVEGLHLLAVRPRQRKPPEARQQAECEPHFDSVQRNWALPRGAPVQASREVFPATSAAHSTLVSPCSLLVAWLRGDAQLPDASCRRDSDDFPLRPHIALPNGLHLEVRLRMLPSPFPSLPAILLLVVLGKLLNKLMECLYRNATSAAELDAVDFLPHDKPIHAGATKAQDGSCILNREQELNRRRHWPI